VVSFFFLECHNQEMGMMAENNDFSPTNSTENYSYNSRIVLPRVENFPKVSTTPVPVKNENKINVVESFELLATPYVPSPISQPESPKKRSLGKEMKKKQELNKSNLTKDNKWPNETPITDKHVKTNQRVAQDVIETETYNDNSNIQEEKKATEEKSANPKENDKDDLIDGVQNVSEHKVLSENSTNNKLIADNIELTKEEHNQNSVVNEDLFVPCKQESSTDNEISNWDSTSASVSNKSETLISEELNSTSMSNKNSSDSISMYKSFLENKIKNEN